MKPGTRPKATKVKEAKGAFVQNPQRKNKKEPKPKIGKPKMPAYIRKNVVARNCWKFLIEVTSDMGLCHLADAHLFEDYCKATVVQMVCWEEMQTNGYTKENGQNSPYCINFFNATKERIRIGAELGLSNSARSRLEAKVDEIDPFTEFLKKGNSRN